MNSSRVTVYKTDNSSNSPMLMGLRKSIGHPNVLQQIQINSPPRTTKSNIQSPFDYSKRKSTYNLVDNRDDLRNVKPKDFEDKILKLITENENLNSLLSKKNKEKENEKDSSKEILNVSILKQKIDYLSVKNNKLNEIIKKEREENLKITQINIELSEKNSELMNILKSYEENHFELEKNVYLIFFF